MSSSAATKLPKMTEKTLCSHFNSSKGCMYGEKCRFLHVLKPVAQLPSFPPELPEDIEASWCCNTNHFHSEVVGDTVRLKWTSDPRGHTIEECKLHCGGKNKSYSREKDLIWRASYTAVQQEFHTELKSRGYSAGIVSIFVATIAPRIPIPPSPVEFAPSSGDRSSPAERWAAAWQVYANQFAKWESSSESLSKRELTSVLATAESRAEISALLGPHGPVDGAKILIAKYVAMREAATGGA